MSAERMFDLGDIISVTTGILASPRHMDGIYDILGFLHGCALWTHQLPRASRDAKPFVLEQHPQLASISSEGIGPSNYMAWMESLYAQYGRELPLVPIPHGKELQRNPLTELAEMVSPDRIIAVDGGAK